MTVNQEAEDQPLSIQRLNPAKSPILGLAGLLATARLLYEKGGLMGCEFPSMRQAHCSCKFVSRRALFVSFHLAGISTDRTFKCRRYS